MATLVAELSLIRSQAFPGVMGSCILHITTGSEPQWSIKNHGYCGSPRSFRPSIFNWKQGFPGVNGRGIHCYLGKKLFVAAPKLVPISYDLYSPWTIVKLCNFGTRNWCDH